MLVIDRGKKDFLLLKVVKSKAAVMHVYAFASIPYKSFEGILNVFNSAIRDVPGY